MTEKVENFRSCCRAIIAAGLATKSDGKPTTKALNYCVPYAHAGLFMTRKEEIDVQVRYILGNMTSWRGAQAKKVRKELKELIGVKV